LCNTLTLTQRCPVQGPYLAGFSPSDAPQQESYGLQRLDHAVGNVHKLIDSLNYVGGFTGFHEFAEFTAEDVGTLDSGGLRAKLNRGTLILEVWWMAAVAHRVTAWVASAFLNQVDILCSAPRAEDVGPGIVRLAINFLTS